MKPREVRLTEHEVTQLRRAAEQIYELRGGGPAPAVLERRLGELVDTIRYLIDRAEEHGQVH